MNALFDPLQFRRVKYEKSVVLKKGVGVDPLTFTMVSLPRPDLNSYLKTENLPSLRFSSLSIRASWPLGSGEWRL